MILTDRETTIGSKLAHLLKLARNSKPKFSLFNHTLNDNIKTMLLNFSLVNCGMGYYQRCL